MNRNKTTALISSTFALFCVNLLAASVAAAADPKGAPAPTPAEVAAESICESDVFYTWKPTPAVEPTQIGKGAPAPTPNPPDPREMFQQKLTERGSDKDQIQLILKSRLVEAQASAQKYCERHHQNQALCISDMLESLGADFSKLDFESRRTLREKLVMDCAHNSGNCVSTRSSDITCRELTKSTAAAAPSAPPAKK